MSKTDDIRIDCHTCFENNNRTGFIAIMLGMTVCFSTLWRFPFQVASFGGPAYILIYLAMLIFFVYPALTAEWGLGRFTGRGPENAYSKLKLPKAIPVFLFIVVFAIGSYFIVWIGWILRYAVSSIAEPVLLDPQTNSNQFFDVVVAADPIIQFIFSLLVVLLVAPTILGGTKIIEKLSRIIVPIFYSLVVIITVFIMIQPGVMSGIGLFFFSIDIATQVTPYTFIAALGQAFFSLCLGGTYMVLYGSYMRRTEKHDIPINAGIIIIGNFLASLISIFLVLGIVIFSSIGFDNLQAFGPGLFFGVIPEAFQSLTGSNGLLFAQILMALFFLMFFFSAYLPMTAIFEVTVVYLVDTFKISRKKAFSIISSFTMLLAIPSILSPLDGGFLYNLDIFVGAIGSVLGSMVAIVSFGWFVLKKDAIKEINIGSKLKLGEKWYFWLKYVTPLFMSFVILYALSDVIIGTFGLNAVPEESYILYEIVTNLAPILSLIIVAIIAVVFYINKRTIKIT